MKNIEISTGYIKLDQFLKWSGIAESGADAKHMIGEGKIKVNGIIALQRGKKLRKGDIIESDGEAYTVV